jgi:hypothetical protein
MSYQRELASILLSYEIIFNYFISESTLIHVPHAPKQLIPILLLNYRTEIFVLSRMYRSPTTLQSSSLAGFPPQHRRIGLWPSIYGNAA